MSRLELADHALVARRDVLGEPATYLRLGGDPIAFQAVFEQDAPIVSEEYGVPVRSGKPGVRVRLADLGLEPVRGDRVTVRGSEYQVIDMAPDSVGGSLLLLAKL